MAEEDCLYCPSVNLASKFEEAASEVSVKSGEVSEFDSIGTGTECCICYEIIGKTNNCVTECGHIFCFKCLATSMSKRNSCPYCRAKLIDEPDPTDEDGEDISEYDGSDEDEDDDDDDDYDTPNPDYVGNIEDIAKQLTDKGVTMLDVVSLLFNKFSKTNEMYTSEYVKELCNKVDQINSDNEAETEEQELMGAEDKPPLPRIGVVTGESILERLANYMV